MKAPHAAIVMKVGFHAGEEWNEIIARKQGEISSTGVTFWGYGGSACHPLRQVQPFAHECEGDVVVTMLWKGSRPRSQSLGARIAWSRSRLAAGHRAFVS